MSRHITRIFAVLFSAIIVLSMFGYCVLPNSASGDYKVSDNLESPFFPRWKETCPSYIKANADGSFTIADACDGYVNIGTYSSDFVLLSEKHIAYELALFGGLYFGKTNNYVIYGQDNTSQDDELEVYRVVKYDLSFNRVASVSIKGGECFTTIPFNAADGDMAEYNGTLTVHTSRQRYLSADGKNHQSQLTIIIDTAAMRVTNGLGLFQDNHVSHSFDQYVIYDEGSVVYLDHGDADPTRSIVLQKKTGQTVYYFVRHETERDIYWYNTAEKPNSFTGYTDYRGEVYVRATYDKADMFKIPGQSSANCTGVSIGGFEMSDNNYIVAMNTIDHSRVTQYTSYEMVGLELDQRDIIVCTVPRNNVATSAVKQITIAEYIDTDKIASIPQIVKLHENDRYIIIWQEFYADQMMTGNLKYVVIDGNGEKVGDIKTLENTTLSFCKPVATEDSVVWFANDVKTNTHEFYSIGLGAIKGTVSISGDPVCGNTLTAVTSGTPKDAEFAYKWYADGVVISSATGETYTLVTADAGKKLSVELTAINTYSGKLISEEVECFGTVLGIDIFTGILFRTDTRVLDKGTSIRGTLTETGDVFDFAEEKLEDAAKFMLYDIAISKDSVSCEPNGKINLLIPVGDYNEAKSAIFGIDFADGTIFEYPTTITKYLGLSYFSTTVSASGFYALVEKDIRFLKGDVNLSEGTPNIADALVLFKHVAGVQIITATESMSTADIDGNGSITISDALTLFKYVAGIISSL